MNINEKTILAFIWRESKERLFGFNKCLQNYESFFPKENILFCDSSSDIFNKSQAVNRGLSHSFNNGAEVVVVTDADALITKNPLMKAINISYEEQKIYLPFDTASYILQDMQTVKESFSVKESFESGNFMPCGSIIVIPKKVYDEIGGFDENIFGWGPEDQEYHYRYYLKYGERFKYIENSTLFSIEHDRNDWKSKDRIDKNLQYITSKYPENDYFKKIQERYIDKNE